MIKFKIIIIICNGYEICVILLKPNKPTNCNICLPAVSRSSKWPNFHTLDKSSTSTMQIYVDKFNYHLISCLHSELASLNYICHMCDICGLWFAWQQEIDSCFDQLVCKMNNYPSTMMHKQHKSKSTVLQFFNSIKRVLEQ